MWNGTLKICDFGLAFYQANKQPIAKYGSLYYIALELYTNIEIYDAFKCDI